MISGALLLTALTFSGRLAIVASSPQAEGQAPLRYAERDADRMAQLLRELGGFSDVWTLHAPSASELERALDRAEALAARDSQLELLIFYSGHADAQGMLLGRERLGYQALRDRLARSRAAVRVVMLDACHSGAVVRTKGGQTSAGFSIEAAAPPTVSGAAILTASTAGELAQESSDIEGSYFTHHLLSALRGAADRDSDGQVTLAEAYQYTAGRTTAATLPSFWGPQHPAYEYQLAGTGDLVLTRLSQGTSALSFPLGEADARYFVTSLGHQVIAEVALQRQRRVRLRLPAGRYRVVKRDDRRASVAELALGAKADVAVEGLQFRDTPPELALAKGRSIDLHNEVQLNLGLSGLGPGILGGAAEVGLGWQRRWLAWSLGAQLSLGRAEGELSGIDYRMLRWTAGAVAMRRVFLALVEVRLGGSLGVSAINQSINGRPHSGIAPMALGLGTVDVPLREWLSLRTSWGFGAQLVKVNQRFRVDPEARAALGTVVSF